MKELYFTKLNTAAKNEIIKRLDNIFCILIKTQTSQQVIKAVFFENINLYQQKSENTFLRFFL
jgi:hypothetical protein